MDIATILGILGGFGLIVGSIGGGIGGFIDIPSIAVVMGGTVAATLIMFPMGVVIGCIKVAMKAFFAKTPDPEPLIKQIVQLADKARKESLVALEKVSVEEPFLKKGVKIVADGSSLALVQSVLEAEINYMRLRHQRGQAVFKGMGMIAPAFGMIGTLIGLVKMLQALDDPSSIGPAMAVALLTTFYGAIIANVVCIPIATKLEQRSNEEAFFMEIAMEGVLAIQNGEHPQIIKEKLESFLAPAMRGGEGG